MKDNTFPKPDKSFKIVFNPDVIVITINVLIFTIRHEQLEVLLIQRTYQPFAGHWSLPGGVFKPEESLEDAACRILFERTGLKNVFLEQLYTFGDPKRDPRERRIAITYYALIPSENLKLNPSGTAKDADWFSIKKLPKLAFDHKEIIEYGYGRLKNKISYTTVVSGLMRKKFRLSELQKAYEIILDHDLDKRNFRKQMKELGLLQETGEKQQDGAHRPAMLYKFKHKNVVVFD